MFFPQQMDECIGRAAEYLPCTSTDAKIQQNDETRWSMWKHRSFFSNAKNNQNKQRVESTTNNKRSVFITINSIFVGLNKHLIAFKFDDIHVFIPIFFLFFTTKQSLCGEQNETLLIWVMDARNRHLLLRVTANEQTTAREIHRSITEQMLPTDSQGSYDESQDRQR